uniref:Uncharacterized protein n=1 Tax=Davidia involucrata TaxID=16924 RepID=A0A5B7BZ87_DAVIN
MSCQGLFCFVLVMERVGQNKGMEEVVVRFCIFESREYNTGGSTVKEVYRRRSLEPHKTMWAASPIPPRPWLWLPKIATASSKPPEPRFALALTVSSKFQRPRDIGGLGHALKSNTQQRKSIKPLGQTDNLPPPTNTTSDSRRPQQERQLSGSDVLLALQRATAKKLKKNRGDYYSSSASAPKNRRGGRDGNGTEQEDEEDNNSDYSNVRPLCMKSGWSCHLDELESQLQQLLDSS